MQHEPCGLLGHSQSTMQFITGDSVLAIHYQPHSREPLIETDWRILENSPDLEREFLFRMVTVAAIHAGLFQIGDLGGLAVGAVDNSIQPAYIGDEFPVRLTIFPTWITTMV